MGIINEKVKELSKSYDTVSILKFNEFLSTCESTDIIEDFSSVIAEPIKGAQFAKEFILVNTFNKEDLNNMKMKLESMISKAELEGYTNVDHILTLQESLSLVDSKLIQVQKESVADLLIDSLYLQELTPVNESTKKDNKTLKAILSKDLSDEDKIKLANDFIDKLKVRTTPLNTAMGVSNVVTLTSIVLYSVVAVPAVVVAIILPAPILIANSIIRNAKDRAAKKVYLRAFKTELKKIDASIESGNSTDNILKYKTNLIEAITILENSEEVVSLESALESAISNDSLSENIKELDMIILENYYRFVFSEDETVEESTQWFNNILAASNMKSVIANNYVTESKLSNYIDSIPLVRKLQRELLEAEDLVTKKRVSLAAMNKASNLEELKYVYRFIKTDSVDATVGVSGHIFTGRVFTKKGRETNKQFREWAYGQELKDLFEKRKQKLESVKESFDDYEYVQEGLFKSNKMSQDEFEKLYRSLMVKIARSAMTKAREMSKDPKYKALEKDEFVSKSHGVEDGEGGLFNIYIFEDNYTNMAVAIMDGQDATTTKEFQMFLRELRKYLLTEFKSELYDSKGSQLVHIDFGDGDEGCLYLSTNNPSLGFRVKEGIYKPLSESTDVLLEGKNADEGRKKVNVAAHKVKTGLNKAKTNFKKGSQAAKAVGNHIDKAGKAIDNAATSAVNKAKNVYRNDIRGEIIEHKTTVKFGRIIRKGITLGSIAAVGPALAAIAAVTSLAMKKKVKEKERRKILSELQEELEIVNEKIEDSRGDEDKEKKYQLMRIRNKLQKDITRIQYGLKADDRGI